MEMGPPATLNYLPSTAPQGAPMPWWVYGGGCRCGQDLLSFSASGDPAASLRKPAGFALVVPCRAHSAALVGNVLRDSDEGCTRELF